jgi:hypothetical protein
MKPAPFAAAEAALPLPNGAPLFLGNGNFAMPLDDEQFYERCRHAILRLSAQLTQAANERQEFAPFLMEALHNAMSGLLEHGDERDLLLLEQWLDEDTSSHDGQQN